MEKNIALVNLSKKMQMYLAENKLSILKLAQKVPDIKYQTLKRIVEFGGEGSLPNITSLIALADFFGCSISALLSDCVTLPINCYPSIEDFWSNHNAKIIQLNIPIDECYPKRYDNIFSIQEDHSSIKYPAGKIDIIPKEIVNMIQIFAKMSKVEYDGYYIVEAENELKTLKVVSVSSKSLMVENNNQIINIETSKVKILAKFINNGFLIENREKLLSAY